MVKKINLCGIWKLNYVGNIRDLKNVVNYDYDDSKWFNAAVPGDVHIDLKRENIIDEPLEDMNVIKCKKYENKIWWYRKKFNIKRGFIDDRVEICFKGIDTTGKIYLNGSYIGLNENALVESRFNVTQYLKEGNNILAIKVRNGLEKTYGKPLKKYCCKRFGDLLNERLWVRKPQFVFSWDWAPRLITCGIYRPVYIYSYKNVIIRDVFIKNKIYNKKAILNIESEIENLIKNKIQVTISYTIKDKNNKVIFDDEFKITLSVRRNIVKKKVSIENPDLWWPSTLGEPALYTLILNISLDRKVLDSIVRKFGIREVKIIEEKVPEPEGGKTFTISINNKKIYAKGANWVPVDSIIARVSEEKYERLIKLAKDANFNMFRIWGGGIYEDEIFYNLCDKYGIMIWQDFIFSVSLYPDDDRDFCKEIRKETIIAVKRLRHHPCVVIYCGNNENQMLWHPIYNMFVGAKKFYGEKIYNKILPYICKKFDGSRPYRPSSPYGGESPNSENEGDYHFWFVANYGGGWTSGTEYERYAKVNGKFISEYGTTGSVSMKSFRKFLHPKDIKPYSKALNFHLNRGHKRWIALKKKINLYLKDKVNDLKLCDLVILTQFLQAETLKFAIEHFRRRKWNTSGDLIWMYSDCWPEVGASIVDYYCEPKPAYYYVKRAYAPVIVSIKEESYGVSVWVVNDTLNEYFFNLECGLKKWDGEIIKTNKIKVKIRENCSQIVFRDRVEMFVKNAFYYAKLDFNGKIISENRHFFLRFKELNIPESKIDYKIIKKDNNHGYIKMNSSGYSMMVCIHAPDLLELEDNFFDIFPGETKIIKFKGDFSLTKKIKIDTINKLVDFRK